MLLIFGGVTGSAVVVVVVIVDIGADAVVVASVVARIWFW